MAIATEGKVTTIDRDDRFVNLAKDFWSKAKVDKKIDFILGMANEKLDQFKPQTFDMIFVDADKTNNIQYYEKCKNLITNNGILIFDNVLWKGKVSEDSNDPKAKKIKEFNSYVKNDNYFEISLISIGDGIMLCKKKNTT